MNTAHTPVPGARPRQVLEANVTRPGGRHFYLHFANGDPVAQRGSFAQCHSVSDCGALIQTQPGGGSIPYGTRPFSESGTPGESR